MTDRRRLGIRALLLALLLPVLVALLALDAWNDYRTISQVTSDAYDQVLLEPIQALAESITPDDKGEPLLAPAFSVQAMFESTRSRHKHLHVSLRALPDGPERTLMGVDDLPAPPASEPGVPVFYDARYRDYPVRIAALRQPFDLPSGARQELLIQAAESSSLREQALADSWQKALWNDTRLVLLMVLVVWLGVWLSLRPLERLRRALAGRRPGELAPLDTRGVPREVMPLVEAVNQHIESQSRLLAAQSSFLADASHQLRTPLAIMSTQVGYALREPDTAPQRETLQAILQQLGRARRLSEQLLALAHATELPAAAAPASGHADLNAVAREVVLQHLPLALEKQQDLGWVDARGEAAADAQDADADTDAGEPADLDADAEEHDVAPVRADPAQLHELLSNLVHNAIRYTPRRGRITVSVTLQDDMVVAEVSDTGPGIEPERRSAVFERFQHGTTAGTAKGGGAGLGLAIARAYARRMGGDVVLEDAPSIDGMHGGLRAVLRLPRLGSDPIRDNTYFEDRRPI
ncbi:sensor histidine kinase [Variovorax dokdonensis]|uniref:histidine kinase n=1 Tax=Variovorax dokdonensis TaxID=344883 RepID=A0ABT7ND99_9BURK|nr:sensor histidine kinase [Variovorax dokdonensis]MDM0045913.1 sensor histidine kinase [Variovorax dokdonensis]